MYGISSYIKTFFGSLYDISSCYDRGFLIDEIMLYLIMYDLFHDPYLSIKKIIHKMNTCLFWAALCGFFSYYRRCKECITIGENHYRRAYLQMLELKVLGAQLHPKK